MIQSFIYTSENNNFYIYDDKHRLTLLVHPEFEKVYGKSTNDDGYYLKKYAYLKKYGFFAKPQPVEFGTLEESVVRNNIINTNQIVFETTDLCNLKCTYCALGELYEGFDERIGKKINIRYAINLLKYIFAFKHKNKHDKLIVSFYGGEALLNMKFIKYIVEVANELNVEKGLELEYSMTTNATLIHKHIDFLVANKFRLLVSLDGGKENHSYRVFGKNNKNSFQVVVDNLDMIQRDYPSYFSAYVNFNAVLHNRNSVKEIYEFIYTRYNKIPRIAELNTRDVKIENKDLVKKMYHSKYESEIEFQKKKSDVFNITHEFASSYKELTDFLKFYSINYYVSNISALLLNDEKFLPTGTCTPFFKKMFLTTRNKLLPCEKINYQYFMGKVNGNIEIDISEITKKYNYYYENIKKVCRNCYAYKCCGSCFFHMDNIDKVDTKEFVCDNFYDQASFKRKITRVFSFLEKNPNDFYQILEHIVIE